MPSDGCDQCRTWYEQGASFCSGCGRYLDAEPPAETPRSDSLFYNTFTAISTVCALVILVLALAYIFLNLTNILNELTDFGKMLFIPGLAVVVLSLVFALYTAHRASGKPGVPADNIASSGIAGFGFGLAVTLGLSYIYIFATLALQQNIGTEIFDRYTEYQLSAMLMLAGPQEEFLYRMLPVGIPLVVIGYATRRRHSWKYFLGGCGTSKAAWLLIIISAVGFGFAHLDSWNLVKVPQAAISGIVFGYLYCEYGAYVSILAHSTLDCISVAGYLVGNPVSSMIAMLLMLCGIILLAIIIIGIHRNGLRHEEWLTDEPPSGLHTIWGRH